MQRLSNAYMKIINQELKAVLPDIIREYERQERNDSRMDGLFDISSLMSKKFSEARERVIEKTEKAKLRDKIEAVSQNVKKTAVGEWKKAVKKTLGIDIAEDYYKDELYQGTLETWATDTWQKVIKAPRELMDKIQEIVQTGYAKHEPVGVLKKEIQEAYEKTKRNTAQSWAESIPYLNAQINKKNQEDAGVKQYVWYSRRDARVRPCHKALDGRTIWWDDPPVQWYETKSQGRVYTGRHAHPGEEYGCRCYAVPVFDKDHFAPPVGAVKGGDENGSGIYPQQGAGGAGSTSHRR